MSNKQETTYKARVINVEQRPLYPINGLYHISMALNALAGGDSEQLFVQAWVTAGDSRKIVTISGDRRKSEKLPPPFRDSVQGMTSTNETDNNRLRSIHHLLVNLTPEDFEEEEFLTLRAHVLNMNPEDPIAEEIEVARLTLGNSQTIDIELFNNEEKSVSDLETIRDKVIIKKNGNNLIVDLENCAPELKQLLKNADIYFIDSHNVMMLADKQAHSCIWQQDISGLDTENKITVKLFIDKDSPLRGTIATVESAASVSVSTV